MLKPYPYVDAMSKAVREAIGIDVADPGAAPGGQVIDITDYNDRPQLAALRNPLPAGRPQAEQPVGLGAGVALLPRSAKDDPVTHVKVGRPPFLDLDGPSTTDIPSEALELLHNRVDVRDEDPDKSNAYWVLNSSQPADRPSRLSMAGELLHNPSRHG